MFVHKFFNCPSWQSSVLDHSSSFVYNLKKWHTRGDEVGLAEVFNVHSILQVRSTAPCGSSVGLMGRLILSYAEHTKSSAHGFSHPQFHIVLVQLPS